MIKQKCEKYIYNFPPIESYLLIVLNANHNKFYRMYIVHCMLGKVIVW